MPKTKRKRISPRRVPLVRAYSVLISSKPPGLTRLWTLKPTYHPIERCETLMASMPRGRAIQPWRRRASYHP